MCTKKSHFIAKDFFATRQLLSRPELKCALSSSRWLLQSGFYSAHKIISLLQRKWKVYVGWDLIKSVFPNEIPCKIRNNSMVSVCTSKVFHTFYQPLAAWSGNWFCWGFPRSHSSTSDSNRSNHLCHLDHPDHPNLAF